MSSEQEIRELVCELCRQFYQLGWVTGTGGSISIRMDDKIFMTPSGVQKERIKPEEIFIVDKTGAVVSQPNAKPGCGPAKLSDCAPLFLHAYNQRNAGAVLHSHGISCNLVTLLFEGKSEFKITKQEMIKGIEGHGYYDELTIPIIENTAWEHELADSLGEAIAKYPKACAVLVRHHGMYVWGKTWEQAKRHGECLHYLFESTIQTHNLGLSHLISIGNKRPHVEIEGEMSANKAARHEALQYKHILLDIEGTVSPISFVKDVLFPYSSDHLEEFLRSNWESPNVKAVVSGFIALFKEDGNEKVLNAEVSEIVEYAKELIAKDRKVTPLKSLQGLIWEKGYKSGDLVGTIFDDVPCNLKRFMDNGSKVSIYSSGSRYAQQLIFGYSNHGDLRKYLTAYFDTKVGMKQEKQSYVEIASTLGVEDAKEILFVTDVLGEANAAASAGYSVLLSIRPENAEVPSGHGFQTVSNFDNI